MAKNQVQFLKGYSLFEFMQDYDTKEQCEQALSAWRYPRRRLSRVWQQDVLPAEKPPQSVAVQPLPVSDNLDWQHFARQHQAAADRVVSGPADPE